MHHGLSANAKETLQRIDSVVSIMKVMHSSGLDSVTDFNVCLRMVDATDNTDFTKTWIDTACGKGSILLAKIKRLIENGCDVKTAVKNIYGIDNNYSQVEHAKINIYRVTGFMPNIV